MCFAERYLVLDWPLTYITYAVPGCSDKGDDRLQHYTDNIPLRFVVVPCWSLCSAEREAATGLVQILAF